MIRDVLNDMRTRMQGAINALEGDLAAFRTGRASPHLLDRIIVEMYGVEMPLNQVASVSVPEPQQLLIRPYDQGGIPAIERAILKSDLGLNPNNDGKAIRLFLPPLNEERRRDLTKRIGKRVEEAKIAVRNVRRDGLNDIRELEHEKMITEDDSYRGQEDLQKLTNEFTDKIDKLGAEKEEEVMQL